MFFPVVFMTLIQNLSPLLIALFSYMLYRVKLNLIEIGVLITSFVGFIILVTGSFKESIEESDVNKQSEKSGSKLEIIVACILMVMIPFNGAII
jgi:drug/metabolite transporter (DMT)-like permease